MMGSRSMNIRGRTPLRAALLAGATALALVAGSGAASAGPVTSYTVNNVGDSFSVDWTARYSGTSVTGSATADFSVVSIGGTTAVLDVTVTNTSTGNTAGNLVRFTSFGWNTAPSTSSATSGNSNVYSIDTPGAISGTSLQVCLYGGRNCNGGANGGLYDPTNANPPTQPKTTNFQLTLNFSSSVPPIDFSGFYGKFQAYSPLGSQEIDGSITPGNGTRVPEPGSLALLGTGLIGLGFAVRRRRRRS